MSHAIATDRAALAPLEGQKIVLTATFKEVHRHVGSRNKVMDALFLGAEVRPLNPEVVIAETTAIKADHLWMRLSLRQGEALARGESLVQCRGHAMPRIRQTVHVIWHAR